MKRKTLSQTLIDAAKDLGFPKATVAKLDELNIPKVKQFSSKEIKKIRMRAKASQGVFAAILNVSPSTLQKWEQGKVRPQGTALRLLSILDSQGVDILRT